MSAEPDHFTPVPPEPPIEGHAIDDKNLAMLTHLSGLLLSFFVPLVVWLMNKDRLDKAYLVSEAREALNFQLTIFIGYVICWILTYIAIGGFLMWVLVLLNLIFCIVAAVSVSKTGSYRYPFALRLVS